MPFTSAAPSSVAPCMRGQPRGFKVIRGSAPILARYEGLRRLAERCGQNESLLHLPYTLSEGRLGVRTPYLLVRARRCGELESAVLFYHYSLYGLPTGVFIPADASGEQNVFAPAEMRSAVMRAAAAFLLESWGLVVLLSLRGGEFSGALEDSSLCAFQRAAQTRVVEQTLRLEKTLDATLATLGSHTRRNLRLFRRRVIGELGATFEPNVAVSETEYLEMDNRSRYPVPRRAALERLQALREIPGSFLVGLRAANGRWLSLLGGRRYPGATTVDWQINASGYPALSIGTAMRAFLLEDEIARGTRLLTFDGGTPHPMSRAFVQSTVSDLILVRGFVPLRLLRRVVPQRLPEGVLLSEMLLSKTLAWRGEGANQG